MNLTTEPFISGQYYYVESSELKYIMLYNEKNTCSYIHLNDSTFYFLSGYFDINWPHRIATNEEREHLDACIKAGKYVTSPKFNYQIW